MRRVAMLRHEFVEHLPEVLDEATLYISIPFATAAHRCCCGCGQEAVTPLSPKDWALMFDGETVSLDPSIGNWSFACQSHYWIERSRVTWARRWSAREIAEGRARDRLALTEVDLREAVPDHSAPAQDGPFLPQEVHESSVPILRAVWARVRAWWRP